MKRIYKNFIYVIAAAGLVFLLDSCREDSGDYPRVTQSYVAFENSSATIVESTSVQTADGETIVTGPSYTVTLRRSAINLDEPLTVNLSINAEYTSSNDFVSAGEDASGDIKIQGTPTTIEFEPGQVYHSFEVISINDNLSAGDKLVTMTITGVSDDDYSIGYDVAGFPGQLELTVQDDDCPIDIPGNYEGLYTLSEEFTAGINEGLSFGFQNVTELTADPSSATGTAAFLSAGEGTAGGDEFWVENTPIEFVTCPQEVVFNSDPLILNFPVNGSTAIYFLRAGTYTESGITFIGDIGNTAGSNFGEYTITLSKQ